MVTILICLVAFLASILTFFSGFGLGTLLAPVLMFFFPVEVAIALTGIVHFFNNVFKLLLTAKYANKDVVIRFGIPAVTAAFIGAMLLLQFVDMPAIYQYSMFGKNFSIYATKLIIAVLLMFFALVDLIPYFGKLEFSKEKLPIGGILSGFFGGLTGAQGALRSAFLIRAGLSKEAFIGTTVVVSTLVDITRLGVYATGFGHQIQSDNLPLLTLTTLSAILGAFIGNKLLKKVTLKFIQILVAILLIFISIGLGAGWL
jgi:uncharacterized membrane protein YfcA